MGLPVKILLPYVGSRVRSNGNSNVTLDRMVMALLPRRVFLVIYARRLHDRIANALVKLFKRIE